MVLEHRNACWRAPFAGNHPYRRDLTEISGRGPSVSGVTIPKAIIQRAESSPSKHFNPVGVPNLFLSPILGAPELTVPG